MKYKHLSQGERDQIAIMLQENIPKTKIAEELQRDYSTIYREITRNPTSIERRHNNSPQKKKVMYLPDRAHKKYEQRRKKSKSPFPLKNPFIYHFTLKHLQKGWSPELISGRLKLQYGERHNISHECIYQFIYRKRGREMRLSKYLPRRHKKRRKHSGRSIRRHLIPNRIDIGLKTWRSRRQKSCRTLGGRFYCRSREEVSITHGSRKVQQQVPLYQKKET